MQIKVIVTHYALLVNLKFKLLILLINIQ